MKIWIAILLVLGTCSLPSLSFCEEKMNYTEVSDPQTLNPLNMYDMISFRFSNLLYNSLVGINIDMIPEPDLLESLEPEISQDKKVYTFKLRKGIMWQDGKEVTAEDIKFTFDVISNPKTDTHIKNLGNIFQDVRVLGSHTVQFILRESCPKEIVLSKLFFKIIPHHIFDKDFIEENNEFGISKVLGSGPYKFKSWKKGRYVEVGWNEQYFKGWSSLKENKHRIKKIAMIVNRDENISKTNLRQGHIHLIPEVRPVDYLEIRSDPYCKLIPYNSRGFAYFGYNFKHPFLKDVNVRQALTFAVNKKAMLQKIYGSEFVDKNQIIDGPFPAGEGDPDIEIRDYNVAKAKELLAYAGFKDEDRDGILEKNGQKFVVSLKAYVKDESFRRICTMYQKHLRDIGIMLTNNEIEFVEINKWRKDVYNKNFDIVFGYWAFSEDTNIVESLFSNAAMRQGGNNFVSYQNLQVEKLLKLDRNTYDPDARKKNKYEFHRIIHDDCPYTFLFTLPKYAGIRSSVLKGVEIHPYHFFSFITNWYLVGSDDE
ncbi:MAG: ABC transporter substrate-binding protein [bacterium]|nr:ABC transporter substrate-binding protein [bacterium]